MRHRRVHGPPLLLLLLLLLAVTRTAEATLVVGVVNLPATFKVRRAFDAPGYWRIANAQLKVLPPLVAPEESLLVALDGAPSSSYGQPSLVIHDARFAPPVLAVAPGTTVTFRNADSTLHILDAKGLFSGKRVGPGDVARHSFDKPGVHLIRCSEVPHLMATVFVPDKKQAVTTTNSKGEFRLQAPPGSYTLRVWYGGQWIHSEPVTVRGARTTVQVQLPLRGVKD